MQPGILIVEDDASVARSLARFFGSHRPVEIAGTIAQARSCVAQQPEWAAVILDLALPDGYGLDFLEELRENHQQMPVLVLTGKFERGVVNRAQALRAEYVCKPPLHENLAFFIKTALSKDRVTEVLMAERIEILRKKLLLSQRETEVLRLLCQCLPRKELALKLGITESTVKSQIRSILRKTGVKTTAILVQRVIRGDTSLEKEKEH